MIHQWKYNNLFLKLLKKEFNQEHQLDNKNIMDNLITKKIYLYLIKYYKLKKILIYHYKMIINL